jgi:hypothetical protein
MARGRNDSLPRQIEILRIAGRAEIAGRLKNQLWSKRDRGIADAASWEILVRRARGRARRRAAQRTKPSTGDVFNLREVDDEIGPAVGYRCKQLGLKGFARLSIDAFGSVQNEMVAEARLSDLDSRFSPERWNTSMFFARAPRKRPRRRQFGASRARPASGLHLAKSFKQGENYANRRRSTRQHGGMTLAPPDCA